MEKQAPKTELVVPKEEYVDDEAIALALTHNLYRFNQYIMQGGNPDSVLSPRPHQELCNTVQDWSHRRKKLILMPRGSFKSSAVTVAYSAQQVCANPNVRILIGSEINATAKKFLREIKDHFENNERLRHFYGDHVRPKSRWTDDEITSKKRTKNLKEPTVFTTGTDQSRTGMHCDIAILDDPVSVTNINTKEAREKTLNWYREIANNILEPGGHLIIIGTRWHYADLYQYILDEEVDEFDVVVKSAISEAGYKVLIADIPIEEKIELIPMESLLFPARLSVPELWSKYKSSGSSMFTNQYLNKVVTDADADFNIQKINYYDPSLDADLLRLRGLNEYISIDPAISLEGTADYTAIVCVGIDKNYNWYVLEYDVDHMKPQELIDRTFEMYKRHPHVRKIGIETQVFQKSLVYSFRDEERKRGIRLPLVEQKRDNQTGKDIRIRGILQPVVEQGRLWLQNGMNDLRDQLRDFPRGRHDDIIDALADCSQIMVNYREGRKGAILEKDDRDRDRPGGRDKDAPSVTVYRSQYTKY